MVVIVVVIEMYMSSVYSASATGFYSSTSRQRGFLVPVMYHATAVTSVIRNATLIVEYYIYMTII